MKIKRLAAFFLVLMFFANISVNAAQYIVQQGETMWSISQKYNISLDELLNANPQINPANLQAGQSVTIPDKINKATYTVQADETLWLISQKLDISLDELLALNPTVNPANIYAGLVIYVPAKTFAPSGKESLTYLYAGVTASYLKILNNSNGSIKTVCTDYFDINKDGSLLITPSNKIDVSFIEELHDRDILVTPFISNHWDRASGNAALDNRDNLSTQVADMIERYNLDGVNVDIENVNEQYRNAYTDFVRLLREKIPSHKIVTVAVAANPKGWMTGWHGSYDYKALSDYSDYLMIMTYDESYQGGPAGPISSKSFFDGSIQYALNQGVPKNKVVAGMPFFGRYWKEGEAVGGIGITAGDIEYLIDNYNSSVRYDKATESANVTITITASDPKPTIWGGRVLTEGKYDIWYDNLSSVRYKLGTIYDLGIRGAGSWALGQESTQTWSFYTSTLNGNAIVTPQPPVVEPEPPTLEIPPMTEPEPVPPVTEPPFEPTPIPEPSLPEKTNIEKILDALNVKDNSRTIKSSTTLTRGEMAVLIAKMTNVLPELDEEPFADTANYWGEGYINALKRRGILRGIGDKYYPNDSITKEDVSSIFDRILVLPNTINYNNIAFKDVTQSMWSYASIAKLCYFDLMASKNKNFFEPYTTMTAADIAQIFDKINKNEYSVNPNKYLPPITTRSSRRPKADITEPIISPR